jgi:hypothetical protein
MTKEKELLIVTISATKIPSLVSKGSTQREEFDDSGFWHSSSLESR